MQTTESAVSVTDDPALPLRRLGKVPRWLGRMFFRLARVDAGAVEYLKELAARGPLVYVMRSRSIVELLLVAYVLEREGLPLPQFVSGLPTLLLHPLPEVLAILWRRLRGGREVRRRFNPVEEAGRCRELVAAGRPALVFMRSRAPGVGLMRGEVDAIERVRTGSEYLRELVIDQWNTRREVSLVPLAVVRGRGFRRKESRFATVLYSVREAPNELRRLVSLLWNRREVSILIGRDIALAAFVDRYRQEGAERITRRLSRGLRLFLHREERLVAGPTLLPKRTVREHVLRGADFERLVAQLAASDGVSEAVVRRRAAKYFDEMAADYSGVLFSMVAWLFNRIWPRIFGGFEHIGLEQVSEHARQHPIVLVPCHRSHFDYLILSYLFHQEYLSPPHIAAGINLSFWPLGSLFRGAGAYFIRRTFGDNELYKLVFRNYLSFLIREGYTQEFFIEGGRSRTGKILSPRLGMLSALVNAYLAGARTDLYFVPVSIHYGRVVEEHAYQREMEGEEKEKESLSGLLRARSVLRQFYGSVYVSFAAPISLRDALGEARERLASTDALPPEREDEKRHFVETLGLRILHDVNAATVVGATSVASTVLLASSQGALRYPDLVERVLGLIEVFAARDVLMTASLREVRDRRDLRKTCEFLAAGSLISRASGADDVVYIAAGRRPALDFYKNNVLHFLLVPCLVTRAALSGIEPDRVSDWVADWLELYRFEFPSLTPDEAKAELEQARGLVESRTGGDLGQVSEDPALRVLAAVMDNFDEAYWLVAREALRLDERGSNATTWADGLRKVYQTGLLLGELRRPEGNSAILLGNAIDLLVAEGALRREAVEGGKKAKKVHLLRLGERSRLEALEARFQEAVAAARARQ